MLAILKEFGRGQITLPKKWRERFDTNVYVAKETSQGLLIIPFTDDAIQIDEVSLKAEVESAKPSGFFKTKSIRIGKK